MTVNLKKTLMLLLCVCLFTVCTHPIKAEAATVASSSVMAVGDTMGFNYTGSVQSFTAPAAGLYMLEVYGGQGGNEYAGSGCGGYSKGYVALEEGQTLYICVGGQGGSANCNTNYDNGTQIVTAGGYNGGGNSYMLIQNYFTWYCNGAGGGATHIATTNRGVLSNYANYKDEVLIVAGGGSGGYWSHGSSWTAGNVGGGLSGGANSQGQSATQTSGYAFGQGSNGTSVYSSYSGGYRLGAGGGGGWYGGYGNTYVGAVAGGGSGYIGGVPEITIQGITYSPSTTSGVRDGNGYAAITFVAEIKNSPDYLFR